MCYSEILEDTVKMLANGGELVYSTCIGSEENEIVAMNSLWEWLIFQAMGDDSWNEPPETARIYITSFQRRRAICPLRFRFVGEHKLPKLKPARSG